MQFWFQGHAVGHDGIKLGPQKTAAIDHWHMLGLVHQLRFCVSLAAYFTRFVPGLLQADKQYD